MDVRKTANLKEMKPHGIATFRCAFYQTGSDIQPLMVKHHWHDEIEIVYLKEGSFHAEINMESYEIPGESLLFIHAGELHYIRSQGAFRESAVVFDPGIISFDSYDTVQSQLIRPLLGGRIRFPRLLTASEAIYPELKKEYELMIHAFQNREDPFHPGVVESKEPKDMLTQLQIKAALLKILLILYQDGRLDVKENQSNQQVEEIKKILTFINQNYKEKIYIRDLAGIINMNEQYFCRMFKKVIGKSPMEYVNEIRIKNAVLLLLNTNMLVMDICLESGFNNLGNFLREFKKHTGTTPLAYRKKG